jgi:hypothetical protein
LEDDWQLKKIISITQASGFQHFTISLALRMSLFNNKNAKKFLNKLLSFWSVDDGANEMIQILLGIVETPGVGIGCCFR